MRRVLRITLGLVGSAALLGALAAALYRAYAPGDLSERAGRLYQRWRPFFHPEGEATAGDIWLFLGKGLLLTLQAAVISIALSLVLGILLALLRLSRNPRIGLPATPPVRMLVAVPTSVVVQTIRSSPLFMLILFTFLAAPRLGLNLSPLSAGILALTLYTSCVLAEIVRAGILSLDRGQFEAADSLGLGYLEKLRFVILPQALSRMVPALVSQLVTLIKDTSLLSAITVTELLRSTLLLPSVYNNPVESLLVAASMYFVINLALSSLARRLEVRPTPAGPSARAALQGIGSEDQTLLVTERGPARPAR